MERKVVVIVGPTCSGKSNVAFILAERLDSEIISADSRQIYKYLDIGTAKPGTDMMKKIRHHFIDYIEPDKDYNVSKFEEEALSVINHLHKKNKVPVVAGGSGLYIKALIDGIPNSAVMDDEYRKEILSLRAKFGNEFLHKELKKIDPVSAGRLLPQNWKRVLRALEVFHLTGKPIWQHHKEYKRETKIEFQQFGIEWLREKLYEHIEERVDEMINLGLLDEVKSLLKVYNKNLNSLNTVGYKEIISFLEGEISFDKAIELIKRNTRRYAKRQVTWFKADKRIRWFKVKNEDDLEKIAEKVQVQVHE